MASEKQSGRGDLPDGTTPQASKKLSPPPHPHRHYLLAGTAGAGGMAETVDGPAPGG